jgi:hypothetical protein
MMGTPPTPVGSEHVGLGLNPNRQRGLIDWTKE